MSPAPAFEELRPGAFAVAYRMLGGVSEAEDVAQEALLRLHRAEHIEFARAYLSTVVTRLVENARGRRREQVTADCPKR